MEVALRENGGLEWLVDWLARLSARGFSLVLETGNSIF